MSDIDELKAKLTTLDDQLAKINAEKVQIEAELKEAERAIKQAALNDILERVRALGLDKSEIAESLGFDGS